MFYVWASYRAIHAITLLFSSLWKLFVDASDYVGMKMIQSSANDYTERLEKLR